MRKAKPVDIVTKLVSILEPLEPAGRGQAIQAALTLLGDGDGAPQGHGGGGGGAVRRLPGGMNEPAYFNSKKPNTKGEELALAARFREERENATASSRAEIEKVIKAARLNFDSRNFRRDLENARIKGLFNRGTGKDQVVLSAYGQAYVDTLPDRAALKDLRGPKGSRGRKGKKKAKASR